MQVCFTTDPLTKHYLHQSIICSLTLTPHVNCTVYPDSLSLNLIIIMQLYKKMLLTNHHDTYYQLIHAY